MYEQVSPYICDKTREFRGVESFNFVGHGPLDTMSEQTSMDPQCVLTQVPLTTLIHSGISRCSSSWRRLMGFLLSLECLL
jgi:hypothetical protein